MKIEGSILNVKSVLSSASTESGFLGGLDVFWPMQAPSLVGEMLCDLGIPA